jgi:hypothetical protein
MELGHDFFGLMKTARYFIGHALIHQSQVQPIRINPTQFDHNEIATLFVLTAASDRLRDFIIVTALGKKNKTNEEGQYKKAWAKLRVPSLEVEADAIEEGFESIKTMRRARNTVVHKLATQPAKIQGLLISRDREAFNKQQWSARDRDLPYDDFILEQKDLDAKELAEVESRAQLLCDCYIKLVKMGELTFRTEHAWRHRSKSQT